MKLIFFLCLATCILSETFADARIWTSTKGQMLEAEYIRDATGKVWLKTSNGKTKVIPISGLCAADKQYILMQKPPKVEIEVDDDVDRGTVGTDVDNVKELIQCSITINKTSRPPYPTEYEVFFYLIGYDIQTEQYILAERTTQKFKLNDSNNNTFSFTGESHHFEYDPDPKWGNRYEGYLVVVKTGDGKVLCHKGREKYFKIRSRLRTAKKVPCRFDKSFRPSTSRRSY